MAHKMLQKEKWIVPKDRNKVELSRFSYVKKYQ